MSSLRELMDESIRTYSGFAGMWYGLVTAPAPLVDGDELYVIIPDIDHNTKWGPCFWSPRVLKHIYNVAQGAEVTDNITVAIEQFPVVGSECLVIFDNRQNIWVAQWA